MHQLLAVRMELRACSHSVASRPLGLVGPLKVKATAFCIKITVIPLLSEGNYSYASVTEKVKRYLAHKVLRLPHCKF